MLLEEHQPESAAAGSGRVGTDNTTLIERVEPISFGAAGDWVTTCLSISAVQKITACPGDIQCFGGGARTRGERHNFLEKRKLKNLSSKLGE